MSAAIVFATFAFLGSAPEATPESRAVAYLAREVPAWSKKNHCYSCHNNGDAARALYRAVKQKRKLPAGALEDTTRWLARPERWDKNGGNEAASDKGLARIQFAAALAAALDAGQLAERKPLLRAAELVVEYQKKDGSWRIDAEGNVGSPATYGAALGTHMARQSLLRADANRFKEAVAKAERWLRDFDVKRVLDAGSVLLALEGASDQAARKQQQRCLEIIRKGEGSNGGWGPYVTSPAEPFDTAVVLLALVPYREDPKWQPLIKRGRRFLIAAQNKDGSWPETTRPPGAVSYAQRLSTTGWATLALLSTSGS